MTDVYSIIVKFFQDGGFFLIPIGIVFFIGLAIAVERWIFLGWEKSRNRKAFSDFLPLLRSTEMDKMHMYTRENQAPVVRIIGCGLDMMKVSRNRADVENAMNEGMLEAMPRLEQRTGYLSVLANVATLLGLLGTIIGLIGAFTAVANADPAEKSTLLSLSISVAMNTTAFGLIAAIPLLVLNAILQNKTKSIVTSVEMSAVKFLNIMTLHRFIEASLPRQPEVTAPSPFATTPSAPVAATVQQSTVVAPVDAVQPQVETPQNGSAGGSLDNGNYVPA
ncbi:MotA/TolQ/ExbB proton channel family protein [Teredinibacter haidensis]|uniref:MotA/TolQ/ExbB proton channel family protein n=1 Tax=Teredinibacter haidensis TaxID=2731755 RepID=UPI000948E6EB|nr:MotA/TolQ/ExbB proton channel family protein [Teredinibacter haidensis]